MGVTRLSAFLLLGAIMFGIWFGHRHTLIPVKQHIVCSSELAVLDAPAADVLFVGTSRTGHSVDPIYIQDKLAERTGQNYTVERLSPTSARLTRFEVLLREYVAKRGVPRVVVFQLIYSRFGTSAAEETRFLGRVPFTGSPKFMEQVISSEIERQDVSPELVPLHRDSNTATRLSFARLASYLYGTIRYPVRKAQGEVSTCPPDLVRKQMEPPYWPYDTVTDDLEPIERTQREIDYRSIYARNEDQFPAEDPRLHERRFETREMSDIIQFLKQQGARVIVSTIPKFEQKAIPHTLIERYEHDLGAPFENPFEGMSQQDLAALNEAIVDGVHVDNYGALIYSRWWVRNLEAELK